ncbi:MAG: TIGR01212 family radical SAM protein [Planctomycetes bacterium]|nr:TIGR01212 family radical SAM protein [Planctomycetota bacterium]
MTSPSIPFRSFAPWLKERYGRPVYRVALDAGSTCPNRDGTKGFGGCTYCDVEGSGTGALKGGASLAAQLEEGLTRIARRGDGVGAIAYLQSYSNTYVDGARFEEVLEALRPAVEAPGSPVVGVSVATRPDCIPEDTLAALARLREVTDVWLELGLESANDQVLLDINRLHTLEEFHDAAERAHGADLLVVGHAILGLPGDGREGARATADALAAARVAGVKVHNLMVLEKTQMAHQYRKGELSVLEAEEYVQWLTDFVERLHPDQVLHRVTGDAPLEKRIAPRWNVYKNEIRERLAAELTRRLARQGSRCATEIGPAASPVS